MNYDFAPQFRKHYEAAAARYAQGVRGAENFCPPEELAFLAANGMTAQHLYDYAEDQHNYGEPGLETALTIELVRRDYFRNVQSHRHSVAVLDEASLPGKAEAIHGVAWLPRILPKARAKLRGELPASLMYCCGGDRAFFKQHDLQPAEFLHQVWHHEENLAAVVEWVLAQKPGK